MDLTSENWDLGTEGREALNESVFQSLTNSHRGRGAGAVQGRAGTVHSGHPWPAVGAGGDGYTRRTPANCRTRASSGGVGQAAGSSAYITQSVAKILC